MIYIINIGRFPNALK